MAPIARQSMNLIVKAFDRIISPWIIVLDPSFVAPGCVVVVISEESVETASK